MKFNSQICTTREQSERLLSLGLKKETADMVHEPHYVNGLLRDYFKPKILVERVLEYMLTDEGFYEYIPAWSLHRLIEMVAGGSEEQMIFLPDPYDELIEEIAGAIMVGCFPKEYLV